MINKTLKYYNVHAKTLCDRYDSIDFSTYQKSILAHLRRASLVLEIGSGSGRDANFMLNKGLDIIGIDGSEEMIKSAIEKYPNLKGKLIQSALPNLFPSFDYKFDGFYSIGTLMHFDAADISIILNKIHSILNANSPVYISVSEKRSEIDERYFIGFSKADWLNTFEKNGFTINEIIESSDLSQRDIKWSSFLMHSRN